MSFSQTLTSKHIKYMIKTKEYNKLKKRKCLTKFDLADLKYYEYNFKSKKKKKKKQKKTTKKYNSYSDYLKSKEWKNKRKRLFKQRNNKCENCGSINKLHLHHLTYKNIFNEKDNELQVLCSYCHAKIHGKI